MTNSSFNCIVQLPISNAAAEMSEVTRQWIAGGLFPRRARRRRSSQEIPDVGSMPLYLAVCGAPTPNGERPPDGTGRRAKGRVDTGTGLT